MSWELNLARAAQRALRAMPTRDRGRIIRALDAMAGNITALRAECRGLYRRRVGSWRIIFSVKPDSRAVLVGDIVRRTSTTYRRRTKEPCSLPVSDCTGNCERSAAVGAAGRPELGLDCLRRYLQGLPVTERTDFERV